jgi:hypothetical protein
LFIDPDKKRYFRVERSHTAPLQAAWSAENVKRRRFLDEQAELVRQRHELTSRHIKRAAVSREPLMGASMEREFGAGSSRAVADIPSAAWAGGLLAKGEIPFVPSFSRSRYPNMPCFFVGGDDVKTGLGVAYASEFNHICADR